jgi:hypothetical protein
VLYLNGSKVATSGSALTFDTSTLYANANFSLSGAGTGTRYMALLNENASYAGALTLQAGGGSSGFGGGIAMYGHSHASYPGATWIGFSSGTSTGILFGSGGNGVDSELMRLTSTGLGIGTSSPGGQLDVYTSIYKRLLLTYPSIYVTRMQLSSFGYIEADAGNDYYKINAGTAAGSNIRFETSGTERMRIDPLGNVGIGTSSPNGKIESVNTNSGADTLLLQVRNNATAASTSSSIRFVNSTSSTSTAGGAEVSAIRNANDGGALTFKTAADGTATLTERLRLDSAGNLGLGVTPSAWTTSFGIKAIDVGSRGSFYASDNDANVSYNAYFDGTNSIYKVSAAAGRYAVIGNEHKWYTAASGTAGNTITFGDPKMTLDASGNLGVGTTSPSHRLQVETPSALADIVGYFRQGSGAVALISSATDLVGFGNGAASGETRIYADGGAGFVTFRTNSVERARIDSSGNLGLGVTPSAWASGVRVLQVGNRALLSAGSTNTIVGNNFFDDGSAKYIQTGFASFYRQNSGEHAWFTAASGTAGGTISFTQAMTLDASGNLGVGETSPSSRLHVSATSAEIILEDSDTARGSNPASLLSFYGSDARAGYIGYPADSNMYITQANNNAMLFLTNNTERARIDSSGNFAVNDTNPAGYNAQFLSVSTSASKYAGVFYGNAASNDGQAALQVAKSSNTNTSSQVLVEFYINAFNTASGRIVANGASAAAFASYSDARLKENIVELPSQLESICALRPVEFDYKNGSGHQIGFIAQEVQEIYPDVIAEGEDGMLTLTGWSKTEARLVKAIQEQQAMIEDLKAKVAALEAK